MDRIEELEARRAARRAEREQAEREQYAQDLEALEALEDEHGTVAAVKVAMFTPGFPTRAFIKTPTNAQYKRYVDQVGKAVEKKNQKSQREAQEILAKSCWIYPKEEADRAAMLEKFPGLLTTIALAGAALAEGKAEEEKNG